MKEDSVKRCQENRGAVIQSDWTGATVTLGHAED